MAAIDMQGATKRYRGADGPALRGLDLVVEDGTICALLGRNGAGKTTAIRILSTLLRFDEGTATVAGFDVRRRAADVRRSIGLIGQHAALDEKLSGRTNLRMIGRLTGLDRAAARRRGDELLDQFDLVDAADRIVGTYSGGMRRRLDLAAGLVVSPPVLLVDEPTTGLDPEARIALWETIERLAASGTTIMLTTQYLEEADRLADRIVMLRDGTAVADGTPDDLKARIGSSWLDLTFGDANLRARAEHLVGMRWATAGPDQPGLHQPGLDPAGPDQPGFDQPGLDPAGPDQPRLDRPGLDQPGLHQPGLGEGRLRVVVPEAGDIAVVCALLAEHDLPPDDLSVGRPTLDDVFLHLHAAAGSVPSVGGAR